MRISDWSSDVCSSDLDGEVELSHRGIRPVGIRHRADEIAAEADEDLRGARYHRLDRLDTMMAVRTRGFEAEDVADAVAIGLRRFFVDADGAVALPVRMTADRRDARAGLAEIALAEEEVRDLLDRKSVVEGKGGSVQGT